jgi:hypothetical protein
MSAALQQSPDSTWCSQTADSPAPTRIQSRSSAVLCNSNLHLTRQPVTNSTAVRNLYTAVDSTHYLQHINRRAAYTVQGARRDQEHATHHCTRVNSTSHNPCDVGHVSKDTRNQQRHAVIVHHSPARKKEAPWCCLWSSTPPACCPEQAETAGATA